MNATAIRLILGFVAGVLAVLIFHQGMFALLNAGGYIPVRPFRMNPVTPLGVPWLINQMFWGGLWGILFAALYDNLGSPPGWAKGLVFGMIGPMLLGSWLVVAVIKGNPILGDYLRDYNILRLRNGFLLNGIAFGIGLGLLYPLLRSLAERPRT
jgi:hypothetical protein